jgi:hypothetical protein
MSGKSTTIHHLGQSPLNLVQRGYVRMVRSIKVASILTPEEINVRRDRGDGPGRHGDRPHELQFFRGRGEDARRIRSRAGNQSSWRPVTGGPGSF